MASAAFEHESEGNVSPEVLPIDPLTGKTLVTFSGFTGISYIEETPDGSFTATTHPTLNLTVLDAERNVVDYLSETMVDLSLALGPDLPHGLETLRHWMKEQTTLEVSALIVRGIPFLQSPPNCYISIRDPKSGAFFNASPKPLNATDEN